MLLKAARALLQYRNTPIPAQVQHKFCFIDSCEIFCQASLRIYRLHKKWISAKKREQLSSIQKKFYSATHIGTIYKHKLCLPLKLERTLLYKTSVVESASENGTALEL